MGRARRPQVGAIGGRGSRGGSRWAPWSAGVAGSGPAARRRAWCGGVGDGGVRSRRRRRRRGRAGALGRHQVADHHVTVALLGIVCGDRRTGSSVGRRRVGDPRGVGRHHEGFGDGVGEPAGGRGEDHMVAGIQLVDVEEGVGVGDTVAGHHGVAVVAGHRRLRPVARAVGQGVEADALEHGLREPDLGDRSGRWPRGRPSIDGGGRWRRPADPLGGWSGVDVVTERGAVDGVGGARRGPVLQRGGRLVRDGVIDVAGVQRVRAPQATAKQQHEDGHPTSVSSGASDQTSHPTSGSLLSGATHGGAPEGPPWRCPGRRAGRRQRAARLVLHSAAGETILGAPDAAVGWCHHPSRHARLPVGVGAGPGSLGLPSGRRDQARPGIIASPLRRIPLRRLH